MVLENVKAKVEQILHKDSTTTHDPTTTSHTGTHTGAHTGTHHTTGNETVTGGPHSSHLGNKVDPTVNTGHSTAGALGSTGHTTTGGYGNEGYSANQGGIGSTGHQTATGGPHNSNLLNKVDPTVSTSHNATGGLGSTGHTATSGYGNERYGNTTGGLNGTTGGVGTTGHHTATGGPHNSNMLNKVDPTVQTGHTATGGLGSTGHTTAGGYGNTGHTTAGGYGNEGYGNTGHTVTGGPHSSATANKLDPTVNTSHSTTGGLGATGHHTGHTGHSGHTGAGAYGNEGYGTTGHHTGHQTGGVTGGVTGLGNNLPGPAPNTAGPHKSDMLNKADPRIDSDLDGSKTVGGNKTYIQNDGVHDHSGPPSASKHTPSEFRKRLASEANDATTDPLTDHQRRHSLKPTDTGTTFDKYGSGIN